MSTERSVATRTTHGYVDRVVSEGAPLAAGSNGRFVELLRPAVVPALQPELADITARRAHGCARCTSRWAGLNTAHCTACHETFTTPGIFDKHRRGSKCLPPEAAGLVPTRRAYRCWATPRSPEMVWQSKSERLSLPPKANDPRLR
jgi:hypothetical protein